MCEEKEREVHHPISLKRKQREQGRLHKNDKNDEIHFPCVKIKRRRVTKKGWKAKEKKMERVNRVSETVKREKQTTETMRVNWEIHHLSSQGDTVTDSFPIKGKESRRVHLWILRKDSDSWPDNKTKMITSNGPVLTFTSTQRKLPCLRKGQTICLRTLVCVGWKIRKHNGKVDKQRKSLKT